ncbi:MAG: NAD-dependent epimerase/dehydratase family protein [Conexivisphaerales archaeon]
METLKVIVTGGAGFIGSHLVRRLIKEGHEVMIIDNLSSGSLQNLADLALKEDCKVGDLRDYQFTLENLKGADIIYHLAADIGSVEYLHGSVERELEALESNVTIDSNVFRACIRNGITNLLYTSSVSVYPFSRQLSNDAVFKEEDADAAAEPEGGYGWAKYLAERELRMMKDVKVAIARIFHAYGENIYLQHDRSQVIASLIRKAINYPGEDFVVWGDGKQKRCFVFIDDVIDAIELLRKHSEKNGFLALNVGSDEEISIDQLASLIIKLSGKRIEIKHDTSKPTGAMRRIPDLTKIQRMLGWRPKTSLHDGLKRTYAWAEKRLSAFR